MSNSGVELIGVGSPLVDLLVDISDHYIERHAGGGKGGMVMVDAKAMAGMINASRKEPARVPGGAAANTTVGCAELGIRTAFIGGVGDDDLGRFYAETLRAVGCEPRFKIIPHEPTGRVLSLITPDAQRTMRTHLGAAAALDPALITPELFAGAKLVMLEGYTLFNHALTRAVAAAAKKAGCLLALDMASFEVVRYNHAVLEELLSGSVDLVFANEDEAEAWFPGGVDKSLDDLAQRARVLAVVKVGKDGAWIQKGAVGSAGHQKIQCGTELVQAIDTTGAGDNWAAGFLAGYLRGLPLVECGKLGAKAGAAVVQVTGARLTREQWAPIRGYLDAWA